jgi:hypothetical protein
MPGPLTNHAKASDDTRPPALDTRPFPRVFAPLRLCVETPSIRTKSNKTERFQEIQNFNRTVPTTCDDEPASRSVLEPGKIITPILPIIPMPAGVRFFGVREEMRKNETIPNTRKTDLLRQRHLRRRFCAPSHFQQVGIWQFGRRSTRVTSCFPPFMASSEIRGAESEYILSTKG